MFCRPVIHKKGEELAKDIKVPDGLNCSDHKTVKLKILEKKKLTSQVESHGLGEKQLWLVQESSWQDPIRV